MTVDGILTAPRRYPFYIKNGLYTTFEVQTQYIEHIEAYMSQ